NPPHIFWDSDVAKWIEAASYSLAAQYDAPLDARLDDVIGKLARLQQPDGYVNSHYILVEPGKRWTNLRDKHELYCAGHLIEAAVAHQQATGKRTLLDIVCKYADHIDATFGRAGEKRRGYCGHEEIELALVKLFHVTGERRYLNLAQYFIDERGVGEWAGQPRPYDDDGVGARSPRPVEHYFDREARERGDDPRAFWAKTYAYMQAHQPVREQTEVVGHAVRAMYLYSAMADLAANTDDVSLLAACERLWHSVCETQMYLTGGIGQTHANEGFTGAYDLPDDTAYAETCAAIGLVMWAQRMLRVAGDGRYADVMERALYNGVLSGVSLDGAKFFYENPLASRGHHHRQAWFDCACCPPNLARLLASLGGYVYSTGERDAWVHLYAQGEAKLEVGNWKLDVRQQTCYPWDGGVRIELRLESPRTFTLHLRVPSWCERWRLLVNGVETLQATSLQNGYLHLMREWSPGDVVTLNMAMPVRYVFAHPNARQMIGRVALQRGPIVYCLEGVDHDGLALDRIALRTDVPAHRVFKAEHHHELLGGVTVLRGTGVALDYADDDESLYRFTAPRAREVPVTAVPYCVWDNRAVGEMRVWLR
ncbi:MAG: beta-L-arabinofuranosidase domain-containing protein, partial [Chloroflexota bacterium]